MKLLTLTIFISASLVVFASDPTEENIDTKKAESRVRFYVIGDYMTIPSPGTGEDLSGFGVAFQGQMAFREKMALGFGARQTFSFGGSAIVTGIDGRFTYAITGKLMTENMLVELGDKDVISIEDTNYSGFRAQFIASQFFFNATSNTVPYNGIGLASYYEWAIAGGMTIVTGARADTIYNNDFSTTPMSVFAGLGISF